MTEFGIQVNDGSTTLSEFAVEENTKFINLYDWQRRAIKYFFDNDGKAVFTVSTGAGKTFCAIEIMKRIWETDPDCKVLIVCPKNIILEDTWYNGLYDAGISIRDIGMFYGEIKEYCKVTITNMQSIMDVQIENTFGFIILDEMHNYATKRLEKVIKINLKYKLGLSATIDMSIKKNNIMLENFFNDDNYIPRVDKYNEHIGKRRIFNFPPKQALDEGVLNPFKFINVGIEMDDETEHLYDDLTARLNVILKTGGGFGRLMRGSSGLKFKMLKIMNERKQLVNNYKRKFSVVKYICQAHINDKIIVFHQYNSQTSKTYWFLLDTDIRAKVIHSGISKDVRRETLADYKKDKFNCLLATKVLDEGYNLPSIDVGIITAGDSTAKQTIQRLGRVLRKKEKESTLYQLYCLNTMEEDQAHERTKLFKQLASKYDEWRYNGEELQK